RPRSVRRRARAGGTRRPPGSRRDRVGPMSTSGDRSVTDTDRRRLLVGAAAPAPEPIDLVAGPLRALLDGVDLRLIRIADAPRRAPSLLDRIYVAVRDRDWD